MRALICAFAATATFGASASRAAEPVIGGSCEGCEAVFDFRRPVDVRYGRISPEGAPGQPMLLLGVVRGSDGRPRSGIVVYGYQTNAAGLYEPDNGAPSRAGRRHGRYRGWVLTDQEGRFEFKTVRPGGYPATDLPEHIHLHVVEPGCATYYLEDVTFDDDPRLTEAKRREFANGRGGSGLNSPYRVAGVLRVQRDIHLGQGIPGYPGCK